MSTEKVMTSIERLVSNVNELNEMGLLEAELEVIASENPNLNDISKLCDELEESIYSIRMSC